MNVLIAAAGSNNGLDVTGWNALRYFQQHYRKAQSGHHDALQVQITFLQKPLDLLHKLSGVDALIIVDALLANDKPGTIFRFGYPEEAARLAACNTLTSSHGYPVLETLRLAEALEFLPVTTVVYGISVNEQTESRELPAVFQRCTMKLLRELHEIAEQQCAGSQNGEMNGS